MIIDEEDYLAHYGILRKSGRYPWGSGGTQSQRNRSFLDIIDGLRRDGMSETQIAKAFSTPDHPFTTTQLRALKSIANNEQKQSQIGQAERLRAKGYSNVAIGQRMGLNESSVRALLAPGQKDKADVLAATSNMLKEQVAAKKFVDVGVGVERHLNLSRTKLDTAIARLKEEGYQVHSIAIDQLGTRLQTKIKVLAPPGTTYRDIRDNKSEIKSISGYTEDGGRSYLGIQTPLSVNSKRVQVLYKDQGGAESDGLIHVRPGVDDISLGGSRYAQVRIAVDGSHYIKGMAMYKDGLPHGVDLVVHTNKQDTGDKHDAMKEFTDDPDNPFGASISRQIGKPGPDGKKILTSAMNIVNEEGSAWGTWSNALSSQILSKQSPKLAETQLSMVYDRKKRELDEIMALTNPAVRRKLLTELADSADSSAVHLKAAPLPRQLNHVILPLNSIKENQIYAPNYKDGERVVLIRHPHGGIFEIPELTVNNRHPEARKMLGNAPDAVAIHHKVAQRLSGADFDGDYVLVIPNNKGAIKNDPALEGLKGFDPLSAYPAYPGMAKMTPRTKAVQMGDVTNLIADMTIHGASSAELARAVRHSMVVIDSEKHPINWKESARVNGIAQLKEKYQGGARKGAATLITRASREVRVPNRRPRSASKGGPIDKATGKKVFEPTGATFVTARGKVALKTFKSKQLAETDDARALSSGTRIEKVYADHSNRLKALANKARQEAAHTKSAAYSPSAKAAYSKQVASLDAKLNVALKNAPLERNAQVLANTVVSQKRRSRPDMEPSELKKVKAQALHEMRARTGAKKIRIDITDDEWEAIQAGAITNNKLTQILNNSDTDQVRKLATPKEKLKMTGPKQARAAAMLASGYTQAEVADALGVSLTTLKTSLK